MKQKGTLVNSSQKNTIGYLFILLLVAVWIPFFALNHSLTSEIHSPLAWAVHLDIETHHHHGNEMDQDHSHPQEHDHDGQFILPYIFVVLTAVAITFFFLPNKFHFLSLFQKKSDPAILLDYHLSIHKTVVLLN